MSMLDMNTDRTINAIGMLLIGAIFLVAGFSFFGRDSNFLMQMVGGSEGYVVEYDLNGGDGDFNRSVIDYEETHFMITDREPTRSSYVFTGWEIKGEAGESFFPGSRLPINDNITLVAQWREGTHTVRYNLNGGTGNLPDDRAQFSTMYEIKTTVPTRTGYHLTGWKNSSDSGVYEGGHKLYITEATTFTAQWAINEYTIAYDLNGGSGEADYPSSTIQHGRNFTISSVTPRREGYDFNGWVSESNDQTYGVGDNFTANTNTTLVADWAVENQRITYDLDGGSYSGVSNPPALTQYAGFSELYSTPDTLPVKAGYVFNGWVNDQDDLTYQAGTSFTVQGDTRLTAQWSLDRYAVTYDLDGGAGSFPGSTVTHNTEYTVRTGTPTKNGYTFNGWKNSLDNQLYQGNEKITIYNNAVLKADWKINNYSITFDLNGGTGTFNTEQANFNDKYVISSRTPVKTGDSFTGWLNSEDNKVYTVGDELVVTGNTTLTAQWNTNSYTVSYDRNGGSGTFNSSTVPFGTNFTVNSTSPTRTGYTFQSWLNTSNDNHYNPGSRFTIEGDTELVAQWELNSYHLNYNLNGGSGSFPREDVNHGVDHNINSNMPVRTGYSFRGWRLGSESALREPGSALTPTGNMTLTAQWEIESHTVTYNLDGGEASSHFGSPHNRNHGVTHTIPTEKPTKTGHEFVRWMNSSDGRTYNPGGSFSVTDDVILTAEWETGIFDITFDINGGSVIDSSVFSTKRIAYDGEFTLDTQVPTRSGVEFLGWLDMNTRNLYQPGELFIVEEDTHFEAQWGHNDYSLQYDADGGSITYPASIVTSSDDPNIGWAEVNSGTKHTVIAGPTKTNYRFTGWEDVNSGAVHQTGAQITITANTTLRATYALNKYTVSFNLNGGSGSFGSQEVIYNSSFRTSSTVPTRTGYTFNGWTRSDTGGVVNAGGSFTMPSQNVTLTARWTTNSYSLTYNLNGGTSGPTGSSSFNFNSTATVNGTRPARTGHTFTGWRRSDTGGIVQPGATFTMPSTNITLTAQWTVDSYTVSYNLNGGSGSFGNQTINYGSSVSVRTGTPTRAGYDFTGWRRSDTGGLVQGGNTFTVSRDVTLTAQWSATVYTITYNRNGGSGGPSSQSKTHGVNVSLSNSTPSRSGYRFDGWTTNSNGTGTRYNPGASYTGNGNVTLHAKWVEQQHYRLYLGRVKASGTQTSSSYGFGGMTGINLVQGQEYVFESRGHVDQQAINDGKVFRAYFYDPSWNTASQVNVHSTTTSTYAQKRFTAPYTGAYRTNGYLYPNGGSRSGTATWRDANLFLINPNGPNAQNNGDVYVDVGTTIRLPQPGQTKDGYTFAGWRRNTDGQLFSAGSNVAINSHSGRVQFTAEWNPRNYNVTYRSNATGGPSNTTGTYTRAFTVNKSSIPRLSGHVFSGWTNSNDGRHYNPDASFTMPMENITLTARWRGSGFIQRGARIKIRSGATYVSNSVGEYGRTIPDSHTVGRVSHVQQVGSHGSGSVVFGDTLNGNPTGAVHINDVIYQDPDVTLRH